MMHMHSSFSFHLYFVFFCNSDYTSEKLDLSDPKTFRDLTKPMGALGSKVREVANTFSTA